MCLHRGLLEEFKNFFSQEDGVVFCNDVCSVMVVLGHEYDPDQWHLFIDSSQVIFKVVLLHNGSRFSAVRLTHAANMKKSYESMKLLLGKIKYDEFKWNLCGDLKVVELLSECKSGTQNSTLSCGSGTARTRRFTTQINCGLNEHH